MRVYPLSLLLLNDKGRRIRLCAFITQFAKSEWQRVQNSSMHVYHSTRCSWMIKGAESVSVRLPPNLLFLNDKGHKIRLCAFIHSACCSWMIKGAEFVSVRLPPNLLFLNDKGCIIRLCAFITQFAKSEWQRAQNSSMRVYHLTRCSWIIKGAKFVYARLSFIERADDRNLSPHVIGPTASGWQKAQKTMLVSAYYHALSLRDSKRKF